MKYKYAFVKDKNGDYKKIKIYILEDDVQKPTKLKIIGISAKEKQIKL